MATASTATSGAIVAEALVLNLTPPSKIATGICFLDHMVDQLTSHGMLGVSLRCGVAAAGGGEGRGVGAQGWFAPLKDYATGLADRPHDRDIVVACGAALGQALRRVVDEVAAAAVGAAEVAAGEAAAARSFAVFCSPLDEAFCEAAVTLQPGGDALAPKISLEPYGNYAGGGRGGQGRRWIGRYRTELTPLFWEALAGSLGCELSLTRVRGGNAHHQLESTFKAFARAFRAALDGIADGGAHGCAAPGAAPVAPAGPPREPRRYIRIPAVHS